MGNQFFYTRQELIQPVVNGKEQFKNFTSSFNVNKVVRSEELDNGNLLVLLDDLHQRWENIEVKNKSGKVTAVKREVNTFQSEIYITDKKEIEMFRKYMSI